MKFNDFVLGVLVLIGAAAILVSARNFSPIPGQAYGAETMPNAIGIVAAGLGIFMMAKSALAGFPGRAVALADWVRSPGSLVGVATALALIGVYIVFSERVGFVPIAFLILLVFMLTLRTRIIVAVPVAIFATILVQQTFGRLLLVPLPRNDFLSFLW
ncbi:putative tricarboxylic transport membrane protein [Rhodopseudomonas julia]|uniref:Tricarboxylic transport membrane protein n=1 Tax=Rhodopseudomonas julia TaxID=200617 RepID=A0ABU0C793_9BRAD|nr:tripartite tricarboxylate transporter TctB family protein [Rhodopseudomonas julia]MDQ0326396.1 putative tricarboxylic transport membrane protein [Rhodopseudomonas julia]